MMLRSIASPRVGTVVLVLLSTLVGKAGAQLTRCDQSGACNAECDDSMTFNNAGVSDTYYKTTSAMSSCAGCSQFSVYQKWVSSTSMSNSFIYYSCSTGTWGKTVTSGANRFAPTSFPAHTVTLRATSGTQCPVSDSATCAGPAPAVSLSPPPSGGVVSGPPSEPTPSAATCADGSSPGSNGCCAATNECPPCMATAVANSNGDITCTCSACAGDIVTIDATCTFDSCLAMMPSRSGMKYMDCEFCSGSDGTCMPDQVAVSTCSNLMPGVSIASDGLISGQAILDCTSCCPAAVCASMADVDKPECAACKACSMQGTACPGANPCGACCPVGTCDSAADGSKPECAACLACQTSGTCTPPQLLPPPPPPRRGALEQCIYTNFSHPDAAGDCSGTGQCVAVSDDQFNQCTGDDAGSGTGEQSRLWHQRTCSGTSILWKVHATSDCSDDVFTACVLNTTNMLKPGCSITIPLDECMMYGTGYGIGAHLKYTGTCLLPHAPPPSSSAPGTTLVSAIRHTISFTAAGTIDSFDKAGVQAALRTYLNCFEPDCKVEVRVTQGSVIVEAVVTDMRRDGSSTATVEAAAALSRESAAGLFKALGVTVEGAVTTSAPSSVMVQVPVAAPDAIDAGNDEVSAGLVAGAIVGCLALVAALGAGGFYCYKKKTPPQRPANIEVVVSAPASDKDAARDAVAPNEQEGQAPAKSMTEPKAAPTSLAAVLVSCGLENRAKLFEDEGYTLEAAFRALDSGESTLKTDLRDLKLTLGDCHKLIAAIKTAKNSKI